MKKASVTSSEIYQLALQSAPSGIMVVGAKGDIKYANQTLADMFEHSLEDLMGKPVEILMPTQFAEAHRRHVEDYARRPQPRSMGSGRDLEGVSRNKRRFPVEIGLRPAQTDSGRVVVATVIDITRRKAVEDRLRRHEEELEELVVERTRELAAAQREKERVLDQLIQAEKMATVGTLVSGIGHEINNPLYVLQAAAEALESENDIDNCRIYGREILKQAKRIATTVKTLSLYARPGSRHDLQRVDMAEAIAEATHLARNSVRGNQVEFSITAEPGMQFLAKIEEIQQILFNILRNAIQASADGGTIEVVAAQREKWVEVHIRDFGNGIPDEYLQRVFDPFFTTKGPDEGEGLGLYIVRQIVSRYGGTIDVENANAGGCRFMIRFPVAERNNDQEEHS
jgi:PAS domain S-box-containing protein